MVRSVLTAVVCMVAMLTGAAEAAPKIPADVTATTFYQWYLNEIANDREPISDRPPYYDRHVAKALSGDLTKAMTSEDGIDEDYFLKAQDYLDKWVSTVNAAIVGTHSDSAEVLVTLGKSKASLQRLRVSMVVENGAWKIRKVRRA